MSSSSTDKQQSFTGPLSGIRVLDIGQVVAGNFCGALLAYFGADVIKVEPPERGDALRHLRSLDPSGTSYWWRTYGRNRRCITVDLHKQEGRDLVKKLTNNVDVLLENFRSGVMEKWGLGPADLNQNLIYTRISGYGQTGPKATHAGYASVCEAAAGFRSVNGYPDRPPVRPNISLGDSLAGLHAAFGTVMALLYRLKTGNNGSSGGQVVDAAITESMFNMMEGCLTEYAHTGQIRPPSGSTISGVVPSGTFKAKDNKYIVIGGNGNSVYNRLVEAMGKEDMGLGNPKFATDSARCENEKEVMDVIEKWVEERGSEEVLKVMEKARVPAGLIMDIADVMEDEQYKARGMFEKAKIVGSNGNGGEEEEVVVPRLSPVLSKTPGSTKWAGPSLGEHTEEVLREFGLSGKEIQSLRDCGAI